MAVYKDINSSVRIGGALSLPAGSITLSNKITLDNASGQITATKFSGDGSLLTNLSSSAMTDVLLLNGTRNMAGNLTLPLNGANGYSYQINLKDSGHYIRHQATSADSSALDGIRIAGYSGTEIVTGQNGTLLAVFRTAAAKINSPLTVTTSVTSTTINATSNLQENGTNLSAKYLQLSGGTMTGQLNTVKVVASGDIEIKEAATATSGAPSQWSRVLRMYSSNWNGTAAVLNNGYIQVDNNGGFYFASNGSGTSKQVLTIGNSGDGTFSGKVTATSLYITSIGTVIGTDGKLDWTSVKNTPATYAPSAHTHPISEVTNLQTTLDGKAASVHTHAISDVTGLQTALDGKVDKVTGKQLSTEDYTTAEKTKLAGISTGATKTASSTTNGNILIDAVETTVYTHPANHPPSIITQDANNRFVTDTDKANWNAKATTAVVTTSANGLMIAADKTKLDGISTGANKVTSSTNGLIKIDGVDTTVYTHPSGDGNLHVPATSTTNNNKVLKAGATAGSLSWGSVAWSEITSVPSTFTPSAHTHAYTDVISVPTSTILGRVSASTGAAEALTAAQVRTLINVADGANNYVHPTGDGNMHVPANGTGKNAYVLKATATAGVTNWGIVDWAELSGKPSTFTPSAHTHPISDITNLQSTLDGKMKYGDVVMNTNPFGGKQLYINSLNNAMFRATERWNVTATMYNTADDTVVSTYAASQLSGMFDGDYEGGFNIPVGQYLKMTIDFGGDYSGYPYGYIYISHYYQNFSSSIGVRVYCNYTPQGVGWKTLTVNDYVSTSGSSIKYVRNDYYAIQQIEFTITAPTTGTTQTRITDIEWQLDRPSSNEMPIVDKYRANNLYSTLTFKDANKSANITLNPNGTGAFKAVTVNGTDVSLVGHTHTFAELTSKPTTLSGFGITDAALATHNHDGTYLKLVGGTVTGGIIFGSGAVPTVNNPNDSTSNVTLSWLNDKPRIRVGGSGASASAAFEIQGVGDTVRWSVDSAGNSVSVGTSKATAYLVGATTVIESDAKIDWNKLKNTPATYAPSAHTHPISDVTNLQTSLDGKSNVGHTHLWADITDKPTTFTPSAHTHAQSDITGLSTALAGKLDTGANAVSASKWQTARTITLSTDATGSVSLDGSGNVTLAVTVVDDSHDHTSLKKIDKRDVKPADTTVGYLRAYFTSLEGLTGTAGTDYQDLLVLNTYTDTSGGSVNALAFDKSQMTIRHYQAVQGATTWGTPKTIAYTDSSITGNASTATKWATARTITLGGDLSGSVSIDGSANATLTAAVADDSHNHSISTVTGLQTALDSKVDKITGKGLSTEDYTTAEKTKLGGISTGANKTEVSTTNGNILIDSVETIVYTHPATHAATMIDQDATHRFVADTDITNWNGKANNTVTISAGIGLTGGGDLTANRSFDVVYGGNGTANSAARSDHNHDSTYLKLVGGTVTGSVTMDGLTLNIGEGLQFTEDNQYFGTNSDARIIRMTDSNDTGGNVDGGLIFQAYTTTDSTAVELLRLRNSQFMYKGNDIWHAGNFTPTSKADKTTTISTASTSGLTGGGDLSANRSLAVNFAGSGSATTVSRSDHNHDSDYVNVGGDTMTGNLTMGSGSTYSTTTVQTPAIVFNTSGDPMKIFAEQYGSNLSRLVIQSSDDGGETDYVTIRNNHYSLGDLDVFNFFRGHNDSTVMLNAKAGLTVTGDIAVTGNVDGVDVSAFKSAYDTHTHTFASLTSKPTTVSGYGITDALTTGGGGTTSGALTVNNTLTVNGSSYADRLYQNWNGAPTSNLGAPSVAEIAFLDKQFTNKTWFYDPTQITFDYTMDGTTWTAMTVATNTIKDFVSGRNNTTINIPNACQKFRITINNDGNYVFLNALYMYWSSQSHSTKVTIEKSLANGSNTWTAHTSSNNNISAWPGHMYLPFSTIAFNKNNTAQYGAVRIVFTPTWSSDPTYGTYPIALNGMEIWGGYPSGFREIYSWDRDKNVTFPAAVTATALNVGSSAVWHAGNLTPSNYLALTGGTVTGGLTVNGGVSVGGSNFTAHGFDFILGDGDQTSRGNTGTSRAMVKAPGGQLVVNYAGDFTGGTIVQSTLESTGRMKATEYYVGSTQVIDTTGKLDWSLVKNTPATYAPSAHTHLWADITDKPTLDNYVKWKLSANTEGTPVDITSGSTVDFKAGSNVTVTRSGNAITIASSYTDTNNYVSGISSTNGGNGTLTLTRSGLSNLTLDLSHNHDTAYLGINAKAVDADKLDGNDSSYFAAASNIAGHSYNYKDTYNVAVGMAESWIKVSTAYNDIVYLQFSGSYDNSNFRDDVVVTIFGYNMKHHITSTTSNYNGSKLLEVKTNNNGSGAVTEIWIRVAACTTSAGSITVRSSHTIPTLTPQTTAPTFGGSGIVNLIYDSTNIVDSSMLITSGIRIDGNKVWHQGNDGVGSGLDADLLDGLDASKFVRTDQSSSISGALTIDAGGATLNLKPGSADHVYMAFYADTQANTTRSGWIGYGSTGTTTMSIQNDMGGNVNLVTTGSGAVQANGNTIWHSGNLTPITTGNNQSAGTGFTVNGTAYIGSTTSGTNNGDLIVRGAGNATIHLDGDSSGTANASTVKAYIAGNGNATFAGTVGVNKITVTDSGLVSNLNAEQIQGKRPWDFDIPASNADMFGYGIISGMAPHQGGAIGPDATVKVDPGTVYTSSGRRFNFATTYSATVPAAYSQYDRWDIYYVRGPVDGSGNPDPANEGTIQYAKGATDGTLPVLPTGSVAIVKIFVPMNPQGGVTVADGTTGETPNLYDIRKWIPFSYDGTNTWKMTGYLQVANDITEGSSFLKDKYARLGNDNTYTGKQTITSGSVNIRGGYNDDTVPAMLSLTERDTADYGFRFKYLSGANVFKLFSVQSDVETERLSIDRNTGFTEFKNDVQVDGKLTAKKNATTVTIPAGQTSVTWTHNYGATTYALTLGSNSFERHVRWNPTSKLANSIVIEIDTASTEDILVDCILMGY